MSRIKLNLTILFAIIIGVSFVGCEKEMLNTQEENAINNKNSVVQVEDFKMQVNNNMLAFETVEDYEKALDYLTKIEADDFKGWDSKLTFTSMRKECESKKMTEEEMPINDNVLGSILNQNAEIQIQGKIFILLPKTEQVIVYDNFKNYTKKTNAREYTFDDEVITKEFGSAEDNYEEINTENECLDCKEADEKGSYCSSKRNPSPAGKKTFGCCDWIKYQDQYNKYGIYFQLRAKIWKDFGGGKIWIKQTHPGAYWIDKKGKRHSISSSISKYSTKKSFAYNFYSGTKRIKGYYIYVNYKLTDVGIGGYVLDKYIGMSCYTK